MKCGNCSDAHAQVATVRACYAGRVHPCTWLIQLNGGEWNDFEPLIVECGAPAIADERGWQCEAGHEHILAEVRFDEGWDYASDELEAAARAGYGHESRLPDGAQLHPRLSATGRTSPRPFPHEGGGGDLFPIPQPPRALQNASE